MERDDTNGIDERVVQAIKASLADLTDPGSGADLMEIGLVRNIAIEDGVVSLTFRPSSTICPAAFTLAPAIKDRVETVDGVRRVHMLVENFSRAEELMALLQDV